MHKLTIFITIFITNISSIHALSTHTLTYKISNDDILVGSETRVLTRVNGEYIYTANAQSEGLIKIFFDYSIQAQSNFKTSVYITPSVYSLIEKENGKITKDISLQFDEKGVHSQTQSWQSKSRLIDSLSMFLALGDDLRYNRALTYQIADGKDITSYTFFIVGTKTLSILDEDIQGIELSNGKDMTVIISPKYDYLPVFITKKVAI